MMCSNSYLNHYIKVGQHPKCVVSSIERAGQPLVKQTVSSAEICNLRKQLPDSKCKDISRNTYYSYKREVLGREKRVYSSKGENN